MKEVKAKVLQDLIKSMGERSVKDLKGKKVKVEDELELEVEPKEKEEPAAMPEMPALNVHMSGNSTSELKKKLDGLFG